MNTKQIRLSVPDQSPVRKGVTAQQAIVTITEDFEDRLTSYKLLADIFEVKGERARGYSF